MENKKSKHRATAMAIRQLGLNEAADLCARYMALARGDYEDIFGEPYAGDFTALRDAFRTFMPQIKISDDPVTVLVDQFPNLRKDSDLEESVSDYIQLFYENGCTLEQLRELIGLFDRYIPPGQAESMVQMADAIKIQLNENYYKSH